jgi:hypothetical protein
MSDATKLAALADRNLCTKISTTYRTFNGHKIRLAHTFWEEKGQAEMEENWHWRIIDDSGKAHFNATPLLFQTDSIRDLLAALDPMTASATRLRTARGLLSISILFLVLWFLSNLVTRIVAVLFFVRSNSDISFVAGAILATITAASVFPVVLRWLSKDGAVSTFDRQWQ